MPYEQIIQKAKEFGADIAGIASAESVKTSPSHRIFGKSASFRGVGTREADYDESGLPAWPEGVESVIVIGIRHPEREPHLDWWKEGLSGGTEGNSRLISISAKLSDWLSDRKRIRTKKLPYRIEKGGVFLKDSAVLAGLGCIGKNNMLVTPEFGPRVRLRSMFVFSELPLTDPLDFDPCESCSMPCLDVCPQRAFENTIYSKEQYGLDELPARKGIYSRKLCNIQMERDIAAARRATDSTSPEEAPWVKYCRRCEFACPVGFTD